jgi:hypothetical protein
METLALPMETPRHPSGLEVRAFSSTGCVVARGSLCSVFVGGTLLGEYDDDDRERGQRNVLMVTLASSGAHLGKLAAAFGIQDDYLRRMRRKNEAGGLASVLLLRTGANSKVTTAKRDAMHAQFAAGMTPKAVWRAQPRRGRLSTTTVWREHKSWKAARVVEASASAPTSPYATIAPTPTDQLPLWPAANAVAEIADAVTEDERGPVIVPMTSRPVHSSRDVQHLGCWILLALAAEMGLHDEAREAFGSKHPDGLRIALEAVMCALAIRQGCVEGVRRLATPSGPALLRAERVPSASGVRRMLGRLIAQSGGDIALDARMTQRLLKSAQADEGPAVFYVDNHLRPYSGQEVVRKGWRMQEKRVLPGTTDYYVHDEDGSPVFRVAVTAHDSLSTWLLPLAKRLRDGLDGERVLLAFDRGGAFAEPLAALRDADFDFVTYERKPYPELAASAFVAATIAGETVGLHESRLRNLGEGRGRIRRIAVRTADGRQVNFLASGKLPAERLVEILWGRWCQENGFKHGTERWGMNQLDDRSVEPYPPGTIIPNPARRRLDRALRLARVEEGDARRKLARLPADSERRAALEQDLAEAIQRQDALEALRPAVPAHAPVEQTILADTLVRHTGHLKTVIDVVRIVCANVESELATLIAAHTTRPKEAKKIIANVFAAPGKVVITAGAIHVTLAPAANRSERHAIAKLLAALSDRNLTLPGDAKRLPLRFEIQLSKGAAV